MCRTPLASQHAPLLGAGRAQPRAHSARALASRGASPRQVFSNRGGFQTQGDFYGSLWKLRTGTQRWALARLAELVLEHAVAFATRPEHRTDCLASPAVPCVVLADDEVLQISVVRMWINVNRRGNSNAEHSHDGTISGVYYVSTGASAGAEAESE